MKKSLLVFLIAAVYCAPAAAESWIQIKGFPIAYDEDSIVRNGDVVSYWLKTTGGEGPNRVQNMWPRRMDCKNRVDEAVGHYFLRADGSREDTGYFYSQERIAPGTDLEALHAAICPKPWEFWKR